MRLKWEWPVCWYWWHKRHDNKLSLLATQHHPSIVCSFFVFSFSCNLNLGPMFCCVDERKTHSSWTNNSYSKLASGGSCTLHILFWQGYCRQCSLVIRVNSQDRCLFHAMIVSTSHLKGHNDLWQGWGWIHKCSQNRRQNLLLLLFQQCCKEL